MDVCSMHPAGIIKDVNCKDVNCICPISCAEDVVMLKNMNGDIVEKLGNGGGK